MGVGLIILQIQLVHEFKGSQVRFDLKCQLNDNILAKKGNLDTDTQQEGGHLQVKEGPTLKPRSVHACLQVHDAANLCALKAQRMPLC